MDTPVEAQADKKMSTIAVLGIFLVVGLVAFVMMNSSQVGQKNDLEALPEAAVTEESLVPNEEEVGEATEEGTMEKEQNTLQEIAIEGGNYYYKPDKLSVNLGDTVRITFSSVDMPHDFNIDELNVHSEILENDSAVIEFIADQVGEFEFYCSVGQHRQLGMIGTLTVNE